MNKIKEILKVVFSREVIMYVIFGLLTTLVNWVVYAVFDHFLTDESQVQLISGEEGAFAEAISTFISKGTAGIIAWVAAVAFAYVTNRLFVFSERAHGAKNIALECGRFVGARVATGVIEIIGVPALVVIGLSGQLLGIDVAKLIISVIVVILNYIFSKLFVFKNSDHKGN